VTERWSGRARIALALAAALLAAAFVDYQLTYPISLAAAGCGLAALFRRRWIAALVSLPAPVLALVSVLAAACPS
jgi:hypothetical protein